MTKESILKAIWILKQKEKFPELVGNQIEILANNPWRWNTGWCDINPSIAGSSFGILESISILENRKNYPIAIRHIIDDGADFFLKAVEESIHGLLTCIHRDYYDSEYKGLDSDCDTEEQVEFAVCLFPRVLSRKAFMTCSCDRPAYPIEFLLFSTERHDSVYYDLVYNLKAVFFIPLLARLGTELGQFQAKERGGLFDRDCKTGYNYVFEILASPFATRETIFLDAVVDEQTLDAMKRLRKLDLFQKEDIAKNCLVHLVCDGPVFSEAKFRYLTSWDPASLFQLDRYDRTPFDYLLQHKNHRVECVPLRMKNHTTSAERNHSVFRAAFEVALCHFPRKKGIGLVFREANGNDNDSGSLHHRSLFQMACRSGGQRKATKLLEDVLIDRYRFNSNDDDDGAPSYYNTSHALLVDQKHTSLDGVYFLLRRNPCVLQNRPLTLTSRYCGGTSVGSIAIANNVVKSATHSSACLVELAATATAAATAATTTTATTTTHNLGKRKRVQGGNENVECNVNSNGNRWPSSTKGFLRRVIFSGSYFLYNK